MPASSASSSARITRARAAGRNLGRFAELLGSGARDALVAAVSAEADQAPGYLWAELVDLPRRSHSANVVVRPAVRQHEIAVSTTPGVTDAHVIPLNELVIGVAAGQRFYTRWRHHPAPVRVCAGHMLNARLAPAACRFLLELEHDGVATFTPFDWGPAAEFPFLPRVQSGRVVLRPAQWRLPDDRVWKEAASRPTDFAAAVRRWRESWNPSRHVYLTAGDNRLLLDLDDDDHLDVLRNEVRRRRATPRTSAITVQEGVPGPEDAWLHGPGGRYLSELVVSLVLRRPASVPASAPAHRPDVAVPLDRRPPGSDWLFLKLYGPRDLEDDLIGGPLRDRAAAAIGAGQADGWFFIRYSDPDPHLRVRFRGDPPRLSADLLPALAEWAGMLIGDDHCHRFAFDTYEREIERFGGPAGANAAEEVFCADSRAVAGLLALRTGGPLVIEPDVLAVLSLDDLLSALGLNIADRTEWCRHHVSPRIDAGRDYRERKVALRAMLADPAWLSRQPGGVEAQGILAARRAEVAVPARRLADLARGGELTQSLDNVFRALTHLHCNRLLGSDHLAEQRALALLLRTRVSLQKAPLNSAATVTT